MWTCRRIWTVVGALALIGALAGCDTGDDAPSADGAPDTTVPSPPATDTDGPPEPADEGTQADGGGGAPDLTQPVGLTRVAELDAAIAGALGPDGRVYLADRHGTVHPLTPDGAGAPVLDLRDRTTTDGERGLLGLAFAADGSELYVSFTDLQGDSVIEAYDVIGGSINADAARTLLTVDQPFANHNGGDVQVGPDGMLYVALGDGGSGGDPLDAGQDRSTLLGSILRIDPSSGDPYAVPADNPFVGQADVAPEIFLYGLRNPWRFSFDRQTGAMWVADVGQNSREEINLIDPDANAGANLGWNRMEGTLAFSGSEPGDHHPPVHEYDTTSARCAVTGGVVYRGEAIPALIGAYLFSDYCEGRLRALAVDNAGEVIVDADLGVDAGRVVGFAEDVDGEVLVLSLDGTVHRIDPA